MITVILLYNHLVAAPPLRNMTLDTAIAPDWVSEPSGRGTWSILCSYAKYFKGINYRLQT
jgi:hypothetical protein